jgi:hypothetical protein
MSAPKSVLGIVAFCILFAAALVSAQFKLERRLALEPRGTFTLETDSGAVVVTGDSTSGALVTITSRREDLDRYFDFQFEELPGAAKVTVRRRGWLTSFFGSSFGGGPQFTVHVPRATTVNVITSGGTVNASGLAGSTRVRSSGGSLHIADIEGNVDGHTSGGSIAVRQVRGDIAIHTSGGGIEVADVRGTARVNTSGGSIEIDAVTGEIYAETSGGGVDIRGAGNRVEAHSSGGPVTVGFAAGNNRGGVLSTSGGGVRVEIDPKVSLTLDASTSGGSVISDVPVTTSGTISRGSLRGDINGGGSLLRLRSSGGGIRISAASRSAASR